MASQISLASVLFATLLALGASILVSSEEGVQELDKLNEGHQLEELDADQDTADGDDLDNEVKAGNYQKQTSPSGRAGRRGSRRPVKRCGPDVTWWLLGQMNRNYNHDVIKYCRRAYPWEFDICLRKFAGLVAHCKPWDFKCTQSFTLGSCPHGCPHTVIICTQCVNHDVPGNIHYGYMGRAAKIPRWILTSSANIVQKDGIDNRRARTAVTIGMDVWDDASVRHKFCMEFLDKLSSLNRHGTSGCHRCDAKY